MTADPVLLAEDVKERITKLDREIMYLLNKLKYYRPKPKPAGNATATNTTNTTSSTPDTNTPDTSTPDTNTPGTSTFADKPSDSDTRDDSSQKTDDSTEDKDSSDSVDTPPTNKEEIPLESPDEKTSEGEGEGGEGEGGEGDKVTLEEPPTSPVPDDSSETKDSTHSEEVVDKPSEKMVNSEKHGEL